MVKNVVLCLVGAFGLAGCGLSAHVEQEISSPDGRYLATVTAVDGGALSSTTYAVVLRHAGDDLPRFGGRVFRSTRGLPVVVWKDSRELRISCRCQPDWIEARKDQWQDVRIVTEVLPIPDEAAEEAIITPDLPRVSSPVGPSSGWPQYSRFADLAGATAGVREPGD